MADLQPATTNSQTSQLVIPQPDPFNVQAVKQYIFNETGNIMIASTATGSETIADSVRDIFSEVAVFFAAMTKAISTSIDPTTNLPYSLYDYNAIQNVVDGSGLFIHVTEEDIVHNTKSYGATFSKELIEGLLGLALGGGALSFAQGMISSIGSAGLKIGGNSESSDNKVANIVFICEYLLGMPVVSAMVVSCDAKQNSQAFQIGPCFSESSVSTSLTLHKDTYMFVTPTFIKKYSGDLESVETNQEFLEFVDYLQALVEGQPIITAVQLAGKSDAAPSELTVGVTYAILGAYLNNKANPSQVTVAWVKSDGTKGADVTNAQVQSNIITFSPTANATPEAIGIFFGDGKGGSKLAVKTPFVYTAVASS